MQKSDKSERKEFGKNQILQHQFQIRRARDPGFRYHILNHIKKDKHVLNMTVHYIQKMLLDGVYFDECKIFSPNSKHECNKKSRNKTVDEDLKHGHGVKISLEERGDDFVNILLERPNGVYEKEIRKSIEYLNQRYEIALEDRDELTATAIKSVISEYDSGMCSFSDLNKKSKFYWENITDDMNFDLSKYFFENVDFTDIYYSASPSDLFYSGNLMSLMGLLELENDFMHLLKKFDIPISNKKNQMMHDPEYLKFLTDGFSIASIIWFNSLDLKDKEKLLNGTYDLDATIVTEFIDKIAHDDSHDFFTLKMFAIECFQNRFFDIAWLIYEYIYAHSDNPHMMSACADKLGDICRENNDYEGALENYKRAYEHADKIQKDRKDRNKKKAIEYETTREYVTIIESLRMAEMEYMLGKTDIANEYLSEIQETSQKLHIDKKLSIMWNLACTYGRSEQYQKEYDCLDELAELAKGRRDDLVQKADDRLLHLNYFINEFNFKFDNEGIRIQDLNEKKNDLMKVADILLKSFQFKRAIECLKDTLNIDNSPSIRLQIAFCYYYIKQANLAEAELNTLINDTEEPEILTYCHLYLAFINFKNNKHAEGYSELEESTRFALLSTGIKPIIQNCIIKLLPLKGEKLLKRVVENILDVGEIEHPVGNIIRHIKTSETLLKFGLVNDAIYFATIALEKSSDDPELKIQSLVNMAETYSTIGNYNKSIVYLLTATDINKNLPNLWKMIADNYSNLLDYKLAEKHIDKALAIEPDNKIYTKLKNKYSELGTDNINFKKITDEDVKRYLSSAERMAIELKDTSDDDDFDFSLFLVSYGKGLETMLHNKISKPLRYKIHKKYNTPIPSPLFKPLRYSLKNIFGVKEKTIQLGSWKYILKDCRSKSNNEIIKTSRDYFAGKLNKNKDMIFNACNVISEYRNGASHYTSKSKDEILVARKEIIEHINKVIGVLYS